MGERPRLLLFDIDGTLILSGGAGIRSVNRAFLRLFGVRDAMERCRPDGKTDPAIFREVARQTIGRDLSVEETTAVTDAYLEALENEVRTSPGYRVMPGVPELLEVLAPRAHLVLGLATGNLERGARLKLDRADLNRYFPTGGFGSDDEDRTALVCEAIRRGARVASAPLCPKDVVIIGDTPHDIEAARGAGARCVAVATGSTSAEDLGRHRPDAVLLDLTDPRTFLDLLETL